jgi:TRAP-type C4-dicarboxylate transport system permease small subunit
MDDNFLTRVSKVLHIVSSSWVLALAVIILVDVVGRAVFNRPLLGTAEIIKNSVVAITFLQIPLAILVGAMLRTTIVLDSVGPRFRALIELTACALGLIFFVALAVGSYGPLLEAWKIGEYEGEGAMRVPTYPVRAIVFLMSILSATILGWQILRILSGKKHTV